MQPDNLGEWSWRKILPVIVNWFPPPNLKRWQFKYQTGANWWKIPLHSFIMELLAQHSDLYLGLDLSTQQLKYSVINHDHDIVTEAAVHFDNDLPEFKTTNGAIADGDTVTSPTLMWVKAMDILLDRLSKHSDIKVENIKGISGAGQVQLQLQLYDLVYCIWKSQLTFKQSNMGVCIGSRTGSMFLLHSMHLKLSKISSMTLSLSHNRLFGRTRAPPSSAEVWKSWWVGHRGWRI